MEESAMHQFLHSVNVFMFSKDLFRRYSGIWYDGSPVTSEKPVCQQEGCPSPSTTHLAYKEYLLESGDEKMHFTAPCISSVGIYDVPWCSNFPSSPVCFFTLLPCAKYPSAVNCCAWQGYKTGLGFSPQTEGCVWQHLWQEDGFRCADLTCLQLSGFAQAGLARACLCVPVRDSHPPLCRPRRIRCLAASSLYHVI